jgi:uncharacterized membrane protein YagU involved in acid resistance
MLWAMAIAPPSHRLKGWVDWANCGLMSALYKTGVEVFLRPQKVNAGALYLPLVVDFSIGFIVECEPYERIFIGLFIGHYVQ